MASQPQQPLQQQQEPAKVTPKITHLSELDQQLSKLHNQRPVLPQQQSYSEAVRQSPTTIQQQIVQPNVGQQVQAPSQFVTPQQMPVTPVQSIQASNQVVTPVPSQIQAPPTLERKLSRFLISKVSESSPQPQQIHNIQQPQQQQAQLQVMSKSSPENELMQQMQQNLQSPNSSQAALPSQQNQAQMFFQQHHGGVVSHFVVLIFDVCPLYMASRRPHFMSHVRLSILLLLL